MAALPGPPTAMGTFRTLGIAVFAVILAACGVSDATTDSSLDGAESFVRIARTGQALTVDAGASSTVTDENFYLAIRKADLDQPWFLSAYLTQWHPSENLPVRTLGTRVVRFKVQNGKLYVFDATKGAQWSDLLDPDVVIEAWPVVTDFAPFNGTPGSSGYVLVDPGAGLNRFDFVADDFAASYQARFQVDLAYLQRFRTMADGVSWEEVFTGYTEVPGPGILGYDQPFRGSGTMALSLRRYSEGAGFQARALPTNEFFGSQNIQYVPNQPAYSQNAVKWNLHAGMQPIPWRISQTVAALEADPRLAGIDVRGAIARGITGWNEAFGFEVFTVVPTAADDSYGDDDKNFVVVDPNPGAGLAFANWRENPNTGEIRGASVYLSSAFVEAALSNSQGLDAGVTAVPDAGTSTPPDAGLPFCAPELLIDQVYGGNSLSAWRNQDFVSLHNRGTAAVSLEGLSLQYGSATGTTWQVAKLHGSVAPGGFFLVGFAQSSGGTAIPTPDLTSSINFAAGNGKVALVQGVDPLSGACPVDVSVLGLVAYGTTNCGTGVSGGSTASIARADACLVVNDFAASTAEPRNAASAAQACACQSPTLPAPFSSGVTNLQLASPSRPVVPALRWSNLEVPSTCALRHDGATAIPVGMTRKEYVEQYLTHVVLHEVGHTLGLRHNFAGSLQNSSVMDYTTDDDALSLTHPGPYDVAAVRYLYGLSTDLPTQPFCTDEDTAVAALCDRFDSGGDPLTTQHTPAFDAKLRRDLAGTPGLTYADLFVMTRYVRGPQTEAQRLQAFNALVARTAPPLSADTLALGTDAAAYADLYNALFLHNLFVDPAGYRDPIGVNPALNDAAFRARVIQVVRDSLQGSDGHRSFETMRLMVDVLKEMQHNDALAALNGARASFVANRAAYDVSVQPLIDDLVRRIDAASSPYFR